MYMYFVMYTSGTDTKLAAFYFHEKYILLNRVKKKRGR